ncbi:type I methionyl aminopeptidase [Fodinibius halophilus]|uniref:Methionine aminopeptidase n=1 Tax=Fodinibius halophilus TaxID=1736908 RepID=A0A6M1T413_9BACT|nr:type I methionyl aminopeptidase [Fodinibius halophilus]NGP90146.1 type I methionyl aminopeptidase [Fodinibius halophilus]
MIYLKSESEIEKMRESAQIVSRTLAKVAEFIEPGVTTGKLDRVAEEYIEENNGRPAFKGYGPKQNPFPGTLCISINEEVVHGIPSDKRKLKEGDIVSIDCGVEKNGYFGDHAYTFAVGECDDEKIRLLRTTLESLNKGIEQAVHGNKVGDISNAIQMHCEEKGFGVVRDLVGHGLGKSLHEDPSVPNFGRAGRGERLRSGMTLAIEPMITLGSFKVSTLDDGWTVVTADKSISAHYEHDVVIREGKAEVLSTFDYIREITESRINAKI